MDRNSKAVKYSEIAIQLKVITFMYTAACVSGVLLIHEF